MVFRLLADTVVVIHFAFIVFVVLGGLLVLRWRWVAWIHVPAAVWGAVIEFDGWICPLTPIEHWFRMQSGGSGYEHGFIEHWIVPVVYPEALTRPIQIALGVAVLVVNMVVYGVVLARARR